MQELLRIPPPARPHPPPAGGSPRCKKPMEGCREKHTQRAKMGRVCGLGDAPFSLLTSLEGSVFAKYRLRAAQRGRHGVQGYREPGAQARAGSRGWASPQVRKMRLLPDGTGAGAHSFSGMNETWVSKPEPCPSRLCNPEPSPCSLRSSDSRPEPARWGALVSGEGCARARGGGMGTPRPQLWRQVLSLPGVGVCRCVGLGCGCELGL